jgi:hypothetical protein
MLALACATGQMQQSAARALAGRVTCDQIVGQFEVKII